MVRERFQQPLYLANRSVTETNLLREQVRWLGSARRQFLTHLPKYSERSDGIKCSGRVAEGTRKFHGLQRDEKLITRQTLTSYFWSI